MNRDTMTQTIQAVLTASHQGEQGERAALATARQTLRSDLLHLQSLSAQQRQAETEIHETLDRWLTQRETALRIRTTFR